MKIKGIYQIINHITNERYVGSSINIVERHKHHINSLLTNSHKNEKLQNAFNYYGSKSFSFQILEIVCGGRYEILLYERKWVG